MVESSRKTEGGGEGKREDLSKPPPPPVDISALPEGSVLIEKRRNLPGLLFLAASVVVLLSLTALIFYPFLAPFILALVIAIMVQPVFTILLRWTRDRWRGLMSLVICVLVVVAVFLPLVWIGWSLVLQADEGGKWLGERVERIQASEWYQWLEEKPWFKRMWGKVEEPLKAIAGVEGEGAAPRAGGAPEAGASPPAPGGADQGLTAIASWIAQSIAGILTLTFGVLLKFVVMLFILFYLLRDGPQILRALKRAIPLEEKYQRRVISTFQEVVVAIVRGALGTALIQGALATVAFLIVGVPALFCGVIAAIASLVPPLGTAFVTIPVTLILFLDGNWGKGVTMAIFAAAIGSLDNILQPLLVGKGMRLHPVWLLMSILGAITFFGGVGIIYGPMILALLGTTLYLFVREEQAEGTMVVAAAPGGTGDPAVPPVETVPSRKRR